MKLLIMHFFNSLRPSVYLSVHMEQLATHWTDFIEFDIE